MRKAINMWYVTVGRPGHEESCEYVDTARLGMYLADCGVPRVELDYMLSEVAKVADGGMGTLRHAAMVSTAARVRLVRG